MNNTSNNWFTFILGSFIIYALVFHHQKLPDNPVAEKEKHETIEKIKNLVDLLTSDLQAGSLANKDQALLEQNSNKDNVTNKPKEQDGFIKQKIYNVIYNVLRTSKGQEVLEKILLNPSQEQDSNKQVKDPTPYNNNSIIDILVGEGNSAECGDLVTVNYVVRLVNGQEIENTGGKPVTFQIGNGEVIKALEYALIGMKQGGKRRLVAPPKWAYRDQKFAKGLVAGNEFITLDIELITLNSALADWQNKIKIFQESDKAKGNYILCGEEIYFRYTLSTSKEQLLATSGQNIASFIIGGNQAPAAISKAFSDIKSEAKRMVFIPGSLLYGKKTKFFPDNVKIPAKETLILEINTGFEEK